MFPENRLVKLLMWGPRNTGEEYKNYWVNNFVDFARKISEFEIDDASKVGIKGQKFLLKKGLHFVQ